MTDYEILICHHNDDFLDDWQFFFNVILLFYVSLPMVNILSFRNDAGNATKNPSTKNISLHSYNLQKIKINPESNL